MDPAAVSRLDSNFFPNTNSVVQLQTKEWGYKQLPYSTGLRPLVRVSLIPGRHEGRRGALGWLEKKETCTQLQYKAIHVSAIHVPQAEDQAVADSNGSCSVLPGSPVPQSSVVLQPQGEPG